MTGNWEVALERSTANNVPGVWNVLEKYPYIENTRKSLRAAKMKVIENMEVYLKQAMESVSRSGGKPHFARDAGEALQIVDGIIGSSKHIIMGKSSVAFEIGLRRHLAEAGRDVCETDFGEFLLQISEEEPSHIITVALHMTREAFGRSIHDKLQKSINENSSAPEMAAVVRSFLADKYQKAEIGITGANAVAADTGSVALVENEGNIRMTTVKPPIHIVVTGVDKIVPTMQDAFNEIMVQSAYAGSYPPTYINFTTGPSSTGDIESEIVRPATGPKEVHVVFIDNGRMEAARDPVLRQSLLCVRCGRCYFACPVYGILGKDWGKPPYSGPTGVMWHSVVTGDSSFAHLCTHSGGCMEVCPMDIDIPGVMEYLKWKDIREKTK
ncbi:MAG: lactate utilization protein [Thermoplasmata archaeon]|nr:lactate utilization protein [Candidatus Sysuiplasma acidicola]MBX8638375.1 lactate utilization protein [Candidatus Sysuiplasma acidicola]MBX8646161.1 lactate utilization protein [Candidatus Sysuiplasma acidicola]